MVAVLADDISMCIFFKEYGRIPIPVSPIDNQPALVQVMTWGRTGNKPLPEPLMTQFIDAYMRHRQGRDEFWPTKI